MFMQGRNSPTRRQLQISGAWSRKDSAVFSDRRLLRTYLLEAEPIQRRFAQLHAIRPSGPVSEWPLSYCHALSRLAADLDGAWTEAELDAIVAAWEDYARELKAGSLAVAVSGGLGRTGYGRRQTAAMVRRAADSIALHAGGASWAEADDRVANLALPSTIAGYRNRLRDRLI
jgi:hypothetical protein